jgi:hypothetical protein
MYNLLKSEKNMTNLPIGYDNFGQILAEDLTFVDKTLFIKEFLDNKHVQVSLITRPRRFGKSLNLSLLHHFFANEVAGQATKGLFDALKIAGEGDAYMRHQGQYPVITITLKDIKERNFQSAYASLAGVLSRLFCDHRVILSNPNIPQQRKVTFEEIIQEKASRSTIENALADLSYCLFIHYGKKPLILIDEYDTPIQSGYVHKYYDEIVELIRNLFSKALKTNLYFYRAVLTGILRVSKESLFSGLNNIDVYSLFRPEYSQYFGFTEEEVNDLFSKSQVDITLESMRDWYNGYKFGNTVIYNPWSIANCIHRQGFLQPYWVGTSDHAVLKNTLAKASSAFKMDIESLLEKKSVAKLVDENFIFSDLNQNESALWSLLLASGYLKAIQAVPEGGLMKCALLFPNKEVTTLYQSLFTQWFSDTMGQQGYQSFLANLLDGNIQDFTSRLEDFLLHSASQFDVGGDNAERFYHGLVLGLIASLRATYLIKSNHESGYGRYDVMLIPKDLNRRGIILEFKTAKKAENLQEAAKKALQQINDKQYEAELRQLGIQSILKLGLAFRGKDVAIVSA